jgi:O-antigen/teichoic acid export membrane protein
VALAACPLGVLMSGAAAPLVVAVFGERWEPMIGPLAVLGIWAAVRPLQSTVEWLLNSVGRSGPLATISTMLFVLQVPALFIAADRSGIVAVAWVMVAHAVVSIVVLSVYTAPAAEISLARQLGAISPVLLASAAAWFASRGAANLTEAEWAGASLALSLAAGAAVYAGVVWLVDRSLLRSVAAQLRRALGRAATPS